MKTEELKKLLEEMSLEEKIGQMVQLPGARYDNLAQLTGVDNSEDADDSSLWLAGSTLGVCGAEKIINIQKEYMAKHPHHIPLMFMLDVIHGYQTAFPCPIGQGAAFDPDIAETSASMSAGEAASDGIHVTFAPMADLVRDARWGRVMESNGEDPYMNGLYAAAAVKGFQGSDPSSSGKLASCVKHFAAYGAPEGGLDYYNTELSEHTFREYYLKAYQKAVSQNCRLVMTSFNSLNGIPSSGNSWLLNDVLRKELHFDGVIISDWGAIGEMVAHGFCEDKRDAAEKAMNAGVDIDMCSGCYQTELAGLIKEGKISQKQLNDAVWRILVLKNELGLFENPFKDANLQASDYFLNSDIRCAAREAVRKTLVLLKNDSELLPLSKNSRTAFIGPYISDEDYRSSWVITGSTKGNVSIKEAAIQALGEENCIFAKGCTLLDNNTLLNCCEYSEENWDQINKELISEALEAASLADTVILCLGESRYQSGEATSRAEIRLPDIQLKLLKEISAVNPDTAVVIFNGRPLELKDVCRYSKSVLVAWLPGTEAGHGILDILTGDYSPSAKLPMSFPVTVGQEPMCYNHYSSGRPRPSDARGDFTTRYLDCPNEPLFPFGFGLSYTDFTVSTPVLSSDIMNSSETLQAAVTIQNIGKRSGTVTLQLYIQDIAASCVRPVQELKSFRKVTLAPGEIKKETFIINEEMLGFVRSDNIFAAESGRFRLWISDCSNKGIPVEFKYTAD